MTDKREEQRNKALHTKSQAGRTQKARPPAARLEGQTLRTPVELYTAWREGGGRGEEERGGGEEREKGECRGWKRDAEREESSKETEDREVVDEREGKRYRWRVHRKIVTVS